MVKGEGIEKEKVDEEETENGAWWAWPGEIRVARCEMRGWRDEARIEGGAQEGNARWERGKKRTATYRMMKAVPVPDLCAIFTLVLMLHARREYLRPRDSGRARSKGTGLLDRYTLAVS